MGCYSSKSVVDKEKTKHLPTAKHEGAEEQVAGNPEDKSELQIVDSNGATAVQDIGSKKELISLAGKSRTIGIGEAEFEGKPDLQRSESLDGFIENSPSRKNALKRNSPGQSITWKKGELIGCGSYGKVYIGLNEATGVLMAVKEVKASSDADVEALQAEITLMRSMRHDNIVQYLGSEADPEQSILYIFTEWVPGGSIANILQKFGRLTESVVRNYTLQLLEGLSYLHRKGIIHRDIKCANILVDDRGTIKLADFGASKVLGVSNGSLIAGNNSLRGTPYYMAPEIIMQSGHGRKADIWSVGCTVLHMISGKPPWKSLRFGSVSALMFHVCNTKEAPPMPEESISPTLRSFLMICFQRDPSERPAATHLLQHPFVQLESPSNSATKAATPTTARSKLVVKRVQIAKEFDKEREEETPRSSSPANIVKRRNKIHCSSPLPQPSSATAEPVSSKETRLLSRTPTHRRSSLQSPTTNSEGMKVLRHIRSASNLKLALPLPSDMDNAQPQQQHIKLTPHQRHSEKRTAQKQTPQHVRSRQTQSFKKPGGNQIETPRTHSPETQQQQQQQQQQELVKLSPDSPTAKFLSTLNPNVKQSFEYVDQIDDAEDDGMAAVKLKVAVLDEKEVRSYLQNKARESEQKGFTFFGPQSPEQDDDESKNEWTVRENTIIRTVHAQRVRVEDERQKAAKKQHKQAQQDRWNKELAAELEFQRKAGLRT